VAGALDDLMVRAGGRFRRAEPRRRARAFVLGLLAELPRKNCWTIAEHAGDPSSTHTGPVRQTDPADPERDRSPAMKYEPWPLKKYARCWAFAQELLVAVAPNE
jgi:hypothetical protein